jgi:hypothetical protein
MRRQAAAGDPFRALGLDRSGELADDDVRAAWRRVAAATHPDRPDGGDPAAFAAAAAAYTALRTVTGRREALADLLAAPRPGVSRRWAVPAGAGAVGRGLVLFAARVSRGRPRVLALRALAAAAVSALAVAVAGWQPASPAIITGAVTWLLLTGRADLSPPR